MPTLTRQPVNNIYWIPIKDIHAMECSEGKPVIRHEETKTLCEGDTSIQALDNLRTYPGYVDNYRNLTLEQRKRIQPFLIDNDKLPEKVLYCDKRFKNRQGDYICGIPVYDIEWHGDKNDESTNMNGEFGMCCIMGYDEPYDCPYTKQREIEQGLRKPEIEFFI